MIVTHKDHSIILDASCIINFYASGFFENILESLNKFTKIATYVYEKEALSVFDYETLTKEVIVLLPFIEKRLIEIVSPTELELDDVFYFISQRLDDGEAYTIAIGKNRDWYIATDDKSAINKLKAANYDKLLDTPQIIKEWAETSKVSANNLQLCLSNIQKKGRYRPSKNHNLLNWWNSNLSVPN